MTSTTPSSKLTILRTDTLVRVKTTPEQREALLDAFETSNISGNLQKLNRRRFLKRSRFGHLGLPLQG